MKRQEKVKNFRDLLVCQKGMSLAKDVYRVTACFPKTELYGLTAQMRRSAVSIPSNIAEGFVRIHRKEYVHFLYIALSSCAELETQFELCRDLGYV